MPRTSLQDSDFSDEELQEALARVLRHTSLAPSSNVAKILEYVVRETVAGRANLLKGFSIGQDVLGKGDSFDPAKDSSVRVEMKKLRDILDHYYRTDGARDPVRIEIVRGNYQPRFVRQVTEAPRAPKPVRGPRVWALMAALAFGLMVAAGLSYVAWDAAHITPSEGDGEPKVFFVDGAASGVAGTVAKQTLSRFHNLKLVDADPVATRADHDLFFALSVLEEGDGFSAELQHLDTGVVIAKAFFAPTGIGAPDEPDGFSPFRIWLGQVFGRNGRLETRIRNIGRPRGDMICSALTEAYFANQTDAAHLAARTCIEDMIDRGYNSARIYADLALLTREEHSDQRNVLPGNALDRAAEAARRAIAIDPFDPMSHYALMTVLMLAGNISAGLEAGERALQLNPFDAEIVGGFAARINAIGAHAEALYLFERRAALSPSRPSWMFYGRFLAHLGQGQRNEAAYVTANLAGSSNPLYLAAVAIGAQILGDTDRARETRDVLITKEANFRDMYTRRSYSDRLVDKLVTELAMIDG